MEILGLLLLLALFLFLGLAQREKFKGRMGELKVNTGLDFFLDREIYHLIKDITLPAGDGTTQIDQLIISRYGVFVVETKNMTGWIFGQSHWEQWTQTIYHHKARFRNPVKQNNWHVKVMQELFDLEPHQVHNVVVFVGDCEFKTNMPPEVMYGAGSLARHVKSTQVQVLAEDEVARLIQRVSAKRLPPGSKTDRAHVRYVRSKISNRAVAAEACPRCGGAMVERTNKQSGERFLGCRRFPHCKGTRPLP